MKTVKTYDIEPSVDIALAFGYLYDYSFQQPYVGGSHYIAENLISTYSRQKRDSSLGS